MTDLSPEAKELLRRARTGFSPGEGRLEAVRSALSAQMAAAQGVAPSTASQVGGVMTRALGAAGWGTGHTVGAAVLIATLGAGGVAMWKGAWHPSAASMAALPRATTALTAPSVPTNDSPNAESPRAGVTATPAVVAAPLVAASAPSVTAPREPHSSRAWAKGRSKLESPRDPPVDTPPAMAVPAPVPAAPSDSLAEEVPILRDARAALDRGDAARALVLLDAHETRFPRGTLYEERLATRVQALCLLGRPEGARLAAQELERAAPRSPHLGRVRASCIAAAPIP